MSPLITHLACFLVICIVMCMMHDTMAAKPLVQDGPKAKKNKNKLTTATTTTTTTHTTTTPTTTTPTSQQDVPAIACLTEGEPPRRKSNKTKKSNRQGKGLKEENKGYDGPGPDLIIQRMAACSVKMDLLVIIDGSSSVGYNNFMSAIEGIKQDVIPHLDMSVAGVRVGFIIFGTTITNVQPFSPNKGDVISALDSVVYPDSGTYTHLAIDQANHMFTTTGRADAIWLILLVTDGRSEKPSKTKDAFNAARSNNINVAAVGVTKSARQSEVYSSVSKNMQHFAKDFDQFRDKVDHFLNKVCGFITR